ncbi:MAG: polyprenyl synthetase family protein [Actinobacteria bacterium]|nr:polyprenyl synthetase family protein [Actinomycetota bacterium]
MNNLSFLKYAEKIRDLIETYLQSYSTLVDPVSVLIIKRLTEFTLRGKMMRGCLLVHSAEKFGATSLNDAFQAAAAVELLHSGILITDDIIDRDEMRRGLPSMHSLMKNDFLSGAALKDVKGEDFAMAVALVASYIGFSMLDGIKKGVLKIIADAFAITGLAEIKELLISVENDFRAEEVEDVYKLKTGIYSICIPLEAGALLAGRQELIPKIKKSGTLAGIAFQIKDDLIELKFGEEITGKPVFSDLRVGRKSYPVVMLYKLVNEGERSNIERMFQQGGVKKEEDISYLMSLFEKYRVQELMEEKMKEFSYKAIENAEEDIALKEIISEIVEFNLQRKK